MRIERINIEWTEWSIQHIARHGVKTFEVEGCLFDDEPIVMRSQQKKQDRYIVLCQCPHGRYLLVVISKPDNQGYVRVITARDMTKRERRLYEERRR